MEYDMSNIDNHPNVQEIRRIEGETPAHEGEGSDAGEEHGGEVHDTEELIRKKIVHILTIYPKISVTMLQMGIGTSVQPKFWKPILEKMVEDGTITRKYITAVTPIERAQTYTILSLPEAA